MSFKLNNFTLDRFNNDVNNCSDPDDKYIRWAQYRQEVTAFVDCAVRRFPAESIAVFGAGTLNDIDLHYLCGTFREVVLTDVDVKSVYDGIERQKVGERQRVRIEIVQSDYTGASKHGFFKGLEAFANKASPVDEIIAYMEEVLRMMRGGEALQGRQFDIVLSCPVYTQLVYTQIEVFLKILYECGLYHYDDLNRIVTAAHHHMSGLLKNYNDLLLSVLKENGLIIVMTDIIEMDGSKIKEIKKILEKHNIKRLEDHIREDGLDFAVTGRDDLIIKTEVIDSFYTVWPYDGNKEYLNMGILCKKTL